MKSRKALEARIGALEQQKYPKGRQFIINVRDGEEDGPHAEFMEEKLVKEHGLWRNKEDMLIKIRNFTSTQEQFEKIAYDVIIHH